MNLNYKSNKRSLCANKSNVDGHLNHLPVVCTYQQQNSKHVVPRKVHALVEVTKVATKISGLRIPTAK